MAQDQGLRPAGPKVLLRRVGGGSPHVVTVFVAYDRRVRPRRVGCCDPVGQRFRPARFKVSPP